MCFRWRFEIFFKKLLQSHALRYKKCLIKVISEIIIRSLLQSCYIKQHLTTPWRCSNSHSLSSIYELSTYSSPKRFIMRESKLLRFTLWSTDFLEYLLRSRAFLPVNYYAFETFSTRRSMLFNMILSSDTLKASKDLHLQNIRISAYYRVEINIKQSFCVSKVSNLLSWIFDLLDQVLDYDSISLLHHDPLFTKIDISLPWRMQKRMQQRKTWNLNT